MKLQDRDYTLILTNEEKLAYEDELAYESKKELKILKTPQDFLMQIKKLEDLYGIKVLYTQIISYT